MEDIVKFLAALAVVLVVCLGALGAAQESVSWPEWRWKPSDRAEVQKVLEGKTSKIFKTTQKMRQDIAAYKRQGYRYVYLVDVDTFPREKGRYWRPYLSKSFISRPTAEAVQATKRFEIAVTWTGKHWDFYVGPGDCDCP